VDEEIPNTAEKESTPALTQCCYSWPITLRTPPVTSSVMSPSTQLVSLCIKVALNASKHKYLTITIVELLNARLSISGKKLARVQVIKMVCLVVVVVVVVVVLYVCFVFCQTHTLTAQPSEWRHCCCGLRCHHLAAWVFQRRPADAEIATNIH